MVVHARKAFTTLSIDQMKAQRAAMRARAKAEIDRMPPKTRDVLIAQMQAQDAAMMRPAKVEVGSTTRTVAGHPCRVTTWTSPQDQGRACLRVTPPIDTTAFRADARAFAQRLSQANLGTGALALPLIILAPHGFPARIEQASQFGPTRIETKTDYFDWKAIVFKKDAFAPPKGYRKLRFDQLMAAPQP